MFLIISWSPRISRNLLVNSSDVRLSLLANIALFLVLVTFLAFNLLSRSSTVRSVRITSGKHLSIFRYYQNHLALISREFAIWGPCLIYQFRTLSLVCCWFFLLLSFLLMVRNRSSVYLWVCIRTKCGLFIRGVWINLIGDVMYVGNLNHRRGLYFKDPLLFPILLLCLYVQAITQATQTFQSSCRLIFSSYLFYICEERLKNF